MLLLTLFRKISKWDAENAEILVPFLRQNGHQNFIFQQDNAVIHVSRSTKALLRITILPAFSPDLNPMEKLWGILVCDIFIK